MSRFLRDVEDDQLHVPIEDGKYAFVVRADGACALYRHGEPWIEEPHGSKALIAAFSELRDLRAAQKSAASQPKSTWNPDRDPGTPMYFCRSCRTTFAGTVSSPTPARRVLDDVIFDGKHGSGITIRPLDSHECPGSIGMCGIGDLIGMASRKPV